jgi:hypothetical protein
VYAILGVNLFGKVKFGDTMTSQNNFRTFGNALIVLMRMITGEGWNFIMYDSMNLRDCDHSLECAVGDCCGSPVAATFYFISFTLVRFPASPSPSVVPTCPSASCKRCSLVCPLKGGRPVKLDRSMVPAHTKSVHRILARTRAPCQTLTLTPCTVTVL